MNSTNYVVYKIWWESKVLWNKKMNVQKLLTLLNWIISSFIGNVEFSTKKESINTKFNRIFNLLTFSVWHKKLKIQSTTTTPTKNNYYILLILAGRIYQIKTWKIPLKVLSAIFCRFNVSQMNSDYLIIIWHTSSHICLNPIVWLLVSIITTTKKKFDHWFFRAICMRQNNNTLKYIKPKFPWSSCFGVDKRSEEKKRE